MKKILITGIEGFTGNHLSKHLTLSGYDVYGTSLINSTDKKYRCDITKKDVIVNVLQAIKPEYIIHLSGISFAAHGNKEDFYKVNTIGTINILDALVELKQSPSKVILSSSATVYGNQGKEVLDESLCPMPSNHYGASKYAMETLAKNYFAKLNIIIARPFNYTGVGQAEHFLVPKIVKHFKEKKKTIELGNLDVSREFNDVRFVCEVYKRLLECSATGEVVNIATNRGVKLLDIINIMNQIAGYNIDVQVNPRFIRKNEIKTLTGSSKKLFSMIEKIEPLTLEDLLKEMYEA